MLELTLPLPITSQDEKEGRGVVSPSLKNQVSFQPYKELLIKGSLPKVTNIPMK